MSDEVTPMARGCSSALLPCWKTRTATAGDAGGTARLRGHRDQLTAATVTTAAVATVQLAQRDQARGILVGRGGCESRGRAVRSRSRISSAVCQRFDGFFSRHFITSLRLTNNPTIDTDPAWSPDGARIAFSSDRNGNHDIYVMSADGSGVTRVTTNPTLDRYPAWSPDGSRLAFSSSQCDDPSRSGYCNPVVFVVGPTGPPVGVGPGDDPAWSPDGRKIAVTTFECVPYYYEYSTCSITGLGILAPFTDGTSGSRETSEPRLTAGLHSQPAWR